MKTARFLLGLCGALWLSACAGVPDRNDATLSAKDFNLEEFFDGKTVAYGQFQDLFGTVKRRFVVQVNGSWDGEVLRLVEDFTYDDGSSEQRIWTLKKTGPEQKDQTWEGSAEGVLGVATGAEKGDSFNWRYGIDLPVKKGTTRVRFDDWMWLLDDDRLLNRAYVSKYGLRIGEVIISFERPS